MTALSVRNSEGYWISLVLFLIFIQMLTSLMVFGGEFISSSEMVISPFQFCLLDDGEKVCDLQQHPGYSTNWDAVAIVGLCAPLVLVPFASLASLFAAFGRDVALLRFSVVLQLASSILVTSGLISFAVLNQKHLSWKHTTVWFYVSALALFELAPVALLTGAKLRNQNRKPSAVEML